MPMLGQQREHGQEGAVDLIEDGGLGTLSMGLRRQLWTGLLTREVTIKTVGPVVCASPINPVNTYPVIDTATERPGAIRADATPVRLAADTAGIVRGDALPGLHRSPSPVSQGQA
jgi:hypothetical protein